MILATDVHYDDVADRAVAAGLLFEAWTDPRPMRALVRRSAGLAPYVPGELYRRELPCLLPLVEDAMAAAEVTTVIVDGYVDLGDRPGLGRHLYEALDGSVPVVGVAKNRYQGAAPVEVLRGTSSQPLYVTAAGMEATTAADRVRGMHGSHRLPTLLKEVDRLARSN